MFRRRAVTLSAAAAGISPPPTYGERASFRGSGRPLSKNMHETYNRHVHKKAKQIGAKGRATAKGRHIHDATTAVLSSLDGTTDARTLRMAQLTDQIFSKGTSFVTSACNISFVPDGNPATPEVAFVGRQYVGKTALLRSLFKDRYAVGHSNTKKRKDAMSFFNVGGVFNVVECPGYGSKSCPLHIVLQHAALIRNFVRCRPSLKMLYYCLDVSRTHGLMAQDVDILRYLSQEVPNFTIVITKGDVLSSEAAASRRGEVGKHFVSPTDLLREFEMNGIHHPMLITSAFSMGGLDTLRYDIVSNCLHALPTEMLTYKEATRLGERLLTQQEIATIRPLQLAPTERDDEEREWRREVAAERLLLAEEEGKRAAVQVVETDKPPSSGGGDASAIHRLTENKDAHHQHVQNTENTRRLPAEEEGTVNGGDGDEVFLEEDDALHEAELYGDGSELMRRSSDAQRSSFECAKEGLEREVDELLDLTEESVAGAFVLDGMAGVNSAAVSSPPLDTMKIKEKEGRLELSSDISHRLASVTSGQEALSVVEAAAREQELLSATEQQQHNYASLSKKLENKEHLAFIRATSPWRNPMLWPSHVIPTRSHRHNIMRCPDDPHNPYLTQPRFVAPRMDMYFRRPSTKQLKARVKDKGLYHADSSLAQLDVGSTIPYFPTIHDVNIMPKPQHFVGISKFFSSSGEGRLEGLLALKQHRDEIINPLGDTSAIANPMLREEVRQLEDERYRQLAERAQALIGMGRSPIEETPRLEGGANADGVENREEPARRQSRIAFLKPA